MGTTVDSEHAAILFADVKGYSVLISRDEVGTYARLQRARALFRALVGDYRGRIVDEAGDGVLAAFPGAGEAVDFALAVQRDLANAAAWQGETRPFAFRIGIHAGPVHIDGERLFGRTLIVAQRIQETAPPGRVCVSAAIVAELQDRQDLKCIGLGVRQLKNLDPMRVFRVEPTETNATVENLPLATPQPPGAVDEASVAVLPFANHSNLPMDSVLCDGITADVIERLSRFREVAVIARHSSFKCRGLLDSPDEVGQILGVRYIAIGTVRRSAQDLRVTAQLLEAESGRLLWSERYDGQLADVFTFQDDVADMIAARVASNIASHERKRVVASRDPTVSAYGLVLRGQDLMLQFREEQNNHARHLFEEAAKFDPDYSRTYSGIAHTCYLSWRYGWSDKTERNLDRAQSYAMRAIEVDELDPRGHAELGCTKLYKRQYPEALACYERAVALNPNDADILADMADAVTAMGQPQRAVELLTRAIRLNPYQPDWYLWHLGDALFNLARYEEAIAALVRMQDPNEAHRLLAASYALLGNMDAARVHADEVRRVHPGFTIANWQQVPPDVDAEALERYFKGLRLAGLK